MGLTLNDQYTLGNLIMTSYPSNWDHYATTPGELSFYQRLKNFIAVWKYLLYYRTVIVNTHQAIARKHFGDDIPDLNELEKNISLVFENQQIPMSFVKPNVPKVIGISGFHVKKKIDPLPTVRAILNHFQSE